MNAQEQEKVSKKPHSVQFNIGKSLGLDGKFDKKEAYKNQIQTSPTSFRTTAQQELSGFEADYKAFMDKLDGYELVIETKKTALVNSLKEIVLYLSRSLTDEVTAQEDVSAKIKELFNVSFEQFKGASDLRIILGELKNKAESLNLKLSGFGTNLNEQYGKFLEKLEVQKTEIDDLETGYTYGEALRIALTIDDSREGTGPATEKKDKK